MLYPSAKLSIFTKRMWGWKCIYGYGGSDDSNSSGETLKQQEKVAMLAFLIKEGEHLEKETVMWKIKSMFRKNRAIAEMT